MKRSMWLVTVLCLMGLVGLLMMLQGEEASSGHTQQELRLASVLSRIEGVGKCEVYLFEAAQQTGFSGGIEESVMVLCEGAQNLSVFLKIQEAVHTATGIPIESIDIYSVE